MTNGHGPRDEMADARLTATLEERLHALAKAMCEAAQVMSVGQHGFMSPCSRCMRLIVAVQRREDHIPDEREAELLDVNADLERKNAEQQGQLMHLMGGCYCPDKEWCSPHTFEQVPDRCAQHGHVNPLMQQGGPDLHVV